MNIKDLDTAELAENLIPFTTENEIKELILNKNYLELLKIINKKMKDINRTIENSERSIEAERNVTKKTFHEGLIKNWNNQLKLLYDYKDLFTNM
jgi:hypothetical protein